MISFSLSTKRRFCANAMLRETGRSSVSFAVCTHLHVGKANLGIADQEHTIVSRSNPVDECDMNYDDGWQDRLIVTAPLRRQGKTPLPGTLRARHLWRNPPDLRLKPIGR